MLSGAVTNATAGGNVEKSLFTITCTTCQARLVVRARRPSGRSWNAPDAKVWST